MSLKKTLSLGLTFIILTMVTRSQSPAIKMDSGSIDGARFRILFPENWKGKLIIYAHGYEFMGLEPRQSRNPRFIGSMKPYLDRGFAIAASLCYSGICASRRSGKFRSFARILCPEIRQT